MPIPVGYDAYLKTAFGDYMTPPPADKQVAHHDAIISILKMDTRSIKGSIMEPKLVSLFRYTTLNNI